MFQKFSLRAHKAALTCITSHGIHVVSSDRDGWIIVWDLASRRPMALWKAHDGHILTLKSTPMGLVSHGRDSFIRIWDTNLKEIKKCSRSASDISAAGNEVEVELPKPLCAEIPVNALNFCNVDFANGLLITPATVDSDNFDVYEVSDPFGEFNFRRVLQNMGPQNIEKSEHVIEEISSSAEETKRAGEGIIMRTLFVDLTLFFVGYESGAVCGFRIEQSNNDKLSKNDRLVMFKDYKLETVFNSMEHKPSPVLSLKFDPKTSQLFTGSASKKLLIYDIKHLCEDNSDILDNDFEPKVSSHNLRHYGVQCIEIADDIILTGFWDGAIKAFSRNYDEIARLERREESIKPETDDQLSKPAKKSLCMHIREPPSKSSNSEAIQSRKMSLRKAAAGQEQLLFVGYGDGLITAFSGIHSDSK